MAGRVPAALSIILCVVGFVGPDALPHQAPSPTVFVTPTPRYSSTTAPPYADLFTTQAYIGVTGKGLEEAALANPARYLLRPSQPAGSR
jgi:hypothetical protein